jgi:hypothetical protein
MRQQNVQGTDKFERAEFVADKLDKGGSPTVTIRLNNGNELTFEMLGKSANFEALATWAQETADELKALGK